MSVCPGHARSQLAIHAVVDGDDDGAVIAAVAEGLVEALRQLRGQPPCSSSSAHR